ncbi:HRAS-like suppressor 3 [Anabarilius grahami]|uniref:HRAS-like suppressor 3 n=1 Tax=Anabarilius grahami TaxID=495550 RepID=A0A3N0Z2W8_ANAGA|nr:HRAS-like suppressor 3 [Anabarilius grahami]
MPLCENDIKALCVSNGIRVKAEEQKEFAMAEDKKPKLESGDLIEIFRTGYQHWAVYVGDGYVIHLASASQHANAGASSMMSVGQNKAIVKKAKLKDVVGNDKCRINNLLDGKCKPRSHQDILQDAKSFVGREVPYNLEKSNCEHFVTLLRYGVPRSQQVEDTAITILISAAAAFGIFILAILRN